MPPEPAQSPSEPPARPPWLSVWGRVCRSLLRHNAARALRSTAAALLHAADRLDGPTARYQTVRGKLSPAVRTHLDGLAAERAASKARHPSTTGRVRHLSISAPPVSDAEGLLVAAGGWPAGPHTYRQCGGLCPTHQRGDRP